MDRLQIEIADGTIFRHADFASQFVLPRHVDVWLPPGYDQTDLRYPVLYMHDGQNVFDPSTCIYGVDWGVDEAIAGMAAAGDIPPAMVVAAWNTKDRYLDYMPEKPLSEGAVKMDWEFFKRTRPQIFNHPGIAPHSDRYLRFLVEELKLFIDSTYRTRPERAATALMGSSMGGLISAYALCEYPEVFGGAACLSSHWPAGGPALADWIAEHLPPPGKHCVYFDFGTQGLDAEYELLQRRVDVVLARRGWRPGLDWVTAKFEGADHNEAAWRSRLATPLRLLLNACRSG
jgi:predicted alpha/beta superfamily hydrolase